MATIISTVLLALSRADADVYFKDFSAVNGSIGLLFCSYKYNTYVRDIWIYYIYHVSRKGTRAEPARRGDVTCVKCRRIKVVDLGPYCSCSGAMQWTVEKADTKRKLMTIGMLCISR